MAGDGFVSEAVKTPEHENLPAAGRQRGDRLVEDFNFLGIGDGFSDIGPILYHGQLLNIPYAVGDSHPVVAGEVDRGVTRGDEKIRPNLIEFASDLGAKEARIGLLNQVVQVR